MHLIGLFVFLLVRQDTPPRVLPPGQLPADARLGPLKDLDGTFPFEVPHTVEAWRKRAETLRRQVQVAAGLWPMPPRGPLNAEVFGRVVRPDFTVDKVAFESFPGLWVTGLLFRPKGKSGRLPGVLSPHGHEGRLWDYTPAGVRKMIAAGQERFERSGRYPQLARCATLARMGCVTFIWDMLGYADNIQIPFALAHRYAKERAGLDMPDHWGFFSTQAELRMQSILGVQAWNALRALDFLISLPDVDPTRIGVTGSSGGGTQTLLLGALDPRPAVDFPQGMVSTSMQGGCTCENACGLRIGTGNVELAALFAPKPQGMTAANDWTKEMMTHGFPELVKLYGMLGAKDHVMCASELQFPHNYNYVTRELMYSWFNRHLKLGLDEPFLEEDFEPLSPAEVRIWDDDHRAPPSGEGVEIELLRSMANASDRELSSLPAEKHHEVAAEALDALIGRSLPPAKAVTRKKIEKIDRGNYWLFTDIVRLASADEELPVVSLYPKRVPWNGKAVLWVDGAGKDGMFNGNGGPRLEVQNLLASGFSVLGADLLYQGEFLKDGKAILEQPRVTNPREFAGFTYGYNAPLFVKRVHDILTLISFVINDEHAPKEITLIGASGAGPLAAAARVQAGNSITRLIVDTGGFRFSRLSSFRHPDFLPGAVKYGDLAGILSLSAPNELWIAGEGERVPESTAAAYAAAEKPGAVRAALDLSTAINWLIHP